MSIKNISTTLRMGSRGDDVKLLQKFFKLLGYSVRIDSAFGLKTLILVKSTQRKVGVKSDGIVGKNTRAAFCSLEVKTNEENALAKESQSQMKPLVITKTLKRGSEGKEVKHLQEILNLGDAKLRTDGDFGFKTTVAVKSFQGKVDIKRDGLVGGTTVRKLNKYFKLIDEKPIVATPIIEPEKPIEVPVEPEKPVEVPVEPEKPTKPEIEKDWKVSVDEKGRPYSTNYPHADFISKRDRYQRVTTKYLPNGKILITHLEEFREFIKDDTLKVVSGWRSNYYNTSIGGSAGSQHRLFIAVDLFSSKYNNKELAILAIMFFEPKFVKSLKKEDLKRTSFGWGARTTLHIDFGKEIETRSKATYWFYHGVKSFKRWVGEDLWNKRNSIIR
jgi:peptidoglycan hydrolase-like protein with peptidoglycan-binding domain